MRPTLSVLIVAFHSREQLARTLPALLPELGEGDELIVVENAPGDGSAELVNDALVVLSGEARADLDGFGWLRAIHPDDPAASHGVWTERLAAGIRNQRAAYATGEPARMMEEFLAKRAARKSA